MKWIIFVLFSGVEYFGLICVSLALFRFELKKNTLKIIGLSLFTSAIVYFVKESEISYLTILVSVLILFIGYMLFFEARILYAFLITITGYLVGMVVQIVLAGLLVVFHIATFADFQPFTVFGNGLQVGTALLFFVIALRLRAKKDGFAFIPEETYTRKKLKFTNRFLLMMNLVSISWIGLFSYLIEDKRDNGILTLCIIGNALLLAITLYMTTKRDNEEFIS